MKRTIALILGLALLIAALTGCGYSIRLGNAVIGPGQTFDVNDHGDQDLSGVNNIDIITVSDTVTLTAGGEHATADLKGRCRSATKPVWLDMHKDGGTITIEVRYPNVTMSSDTALAVSIPANYSGSLSIKTVSGNIEAEGLPYELQNVTLGTISGGANFGAASISGLTATTVSGDMSVSGIAGATVAGSVSGGINLDYSAIAAATVTSVSGNVDMQVPKESAFHVDFHSISGSFHSSNTGLDVSSAGQGFSGSTGTDGALIKVNTTSSDFRIEGK